MADSSRADSSRAERGRAERGRGWDRLSMLAVAGVFTTAGVLLGRRAPRVAGAVASGASDDGGSARGRPTQPPSRRARREGFEPKDISARGASLVILGWLCLVLVVVAGLATLRGIYARTDRADAPPVTAQTGATVVPPGPRMQADPPRDLDSLRAYEAQVLGSYATLPDDPTHARIPITDAMQRVIGRSLDPATPAAKP